MFLAERRPRKSPLRSAVPSYDVKIIAGRRVVIFHEKAKKEQSGTSTESAESSAESNGKEPQSADKDKPKENIDEKQESQDKSDQKESEKRTTQYLRYYCWCMKHKELSRPLFDF